MCIRDSDRGGGSRHLRDEARDRHRGVDATAVATAVRAGHRDEQVVVEVGARQQGGAVAAQPVSYTHLTLPTSDLV